MHLFKIKMVLPPVLSEPSVSVFWSGFYLKTKYAYLANNALKYSSDNCGVGFLTCQFGDSRSTTPLTTPLPPFGRGKREARLGNLRHN